MALTVLTASSETALITLADVKVRLGIASTVTTYDSLLTALLEDASALVASYLGRALGRARYTETLPGNDRQRITLARFPVDRDSVTLTIDGSAETDFTVLDPASGILWREGLWTSGVNASRVWEEPESNISVTYKAGWILPDQISDYAASTSLSAGSWTRPAAPVQDLAFEVTTAGTSGSAAPSWPTTAGSTVTATGGTAVWTARHAAELPRVITSVTWLATRRTWGASQFLAGVREMESDGQRTAFFDAQARDVGSLTDVEMAALAPYMAAG